jgi:hypothetical protein
MARKPAKSNGTKIGSAARMPATTMTNAATVNRNRPAKRMTALAFIKKRFIVKNPLIYRITCAFLMSMIPVFSFSVLDEGG